MTIRRLLQSPRARRGIAAGAIVLSLGGLVLYRADVGARAIPVAAADFGNGISSVVPIDSHIFINPDLSVHVTRPPVGEWVALAAVTHPTDRGVGLAESAMYDRDGRIGRAVQSLLLDRV